MPQITRPIDVHCVTRWSKPAMEFTGVPLATLIGDGSSSIWNSQAKFVSFISRSERRHSTSLPLDDVISLEPLIALAAQGEPISMEHGGPIRIVVPGKYFYKSVKWLEEIEFLAIDKLGYWEADAGYHNEADPWKEQRYIASTISKQKAKQLIEDRDFCGLDLLSLDARGRDLSGLKATQAQLRNCRFDECQLQRADFCKANLSNASLCRSSLLEADFSHSDLEGADLSGSDLRGASFVNASLFGATFCHTGMDGNPINGAIVDATTRFSANSLDALTDFQQAYIQSCR